MQCKFFSLKNLKQNRCNHKNVSFYKYCGKFFHFFSLVIQIVRYTIWFELNSSYCHIFCRVCRVGNSIIFQQIAIILWFPQSLIGQCYFSLSLVPIRLFVIIRKNPYTCCWFFSCLCEWMTQHSGKNLMWNQ